MTVYKVVDMDGQVLGRDSRNYKKLNLNEILTSEFGEASAWLLFWEQYRVDFAWYDGLSGKIFWPENKAVQEDLLVETRIFNEEQELHIKLMPEGDYKGRLLNRISANEIEKSLVDEAHFLYSMESLPYMWGSKIENGCILEDRGMRYHLPFTKNTSMINFGYRVMAFYEPDREDGMLRLMDYCMTDIYQEIGHKKIMLDGGGYGG